MRLPKVSPASIKNHIDWWWQAINTFVVATGATFAILVCLSNTFTASARAIWVDCHDNWLAVWLWLKENFSDEFLMVSLPLLSMYLVFWGLNAVLLYVDLKGVKSWKDFKVQDGTNEAFDFDDLKKVLEVVCMNQLVTIPVAIAFAYLLDPAVVCSTNIPSFNRVMVEIFLCVLVEEPMFYYSHRLFHHRKLYAYVHKVHHEWTAPIGLIALYAHPLEHVCANLLPVLAGPYLLGSHMSTSCFWVSIAVFNATMTHSGYHLPYIASNEAHDYHHLMFNENFGVLGVLDYLHGTDIKFRRSRQFELHKTFYNDSYTRLRIRKEVSKKVDDEDLN